MKLVRITAVVASALIIAPACGDDDSSSDGSSDDDESEDDESEDDDDSDDDDDSGEDAGTDATFDDERAYAFESKFTAGESSVSYSGQTWRHVAILELNSTILGLTDDIDSEALVPEEGTVVSALDFFLNFDPDNGNNSLSLETDPESLQTTYDEISTDKNLIDKIAGNDDVTDFKDWDGGDFEGWGDAASPEALITEWFEAIEDNAMDHANAPRQLGDVSLPVYVSETGLDYQQLVQKFITGAIAFAQGADDYLDDDVEDKGLLASNEQSEDSSYSALEHAWDEGFGYFGAARDFDEYTDEEIAGDGGRDGWISYHDSDEDDSIDLVSEYNFGHAVNAAKRDLGAIEATDFTTDAFEALVAGRQLITDVEGELSDDELEELRGYRDTALGAWEKAISATVVHYINDTLQDMGKFGTEEYSFLDHAKHWGEMKGFALVLQFNPRSPLNEGTLFTDLHDLIGTAPVLDDADADDIAAYQQALLDARELVGTAYDFDASNLGDDNGENGW